MRVENQISLWISIILLLQNDIFQVVSSSAIECSILADLYTSTGGSGWINQWDTSVIYSGCSTNICKQTLYGVKCSGGSHLSSLNLSGNNLIGILPNTLDQLQRLTSLDLSFNTLYSPSTFTISSTTLVTLNLANNAFVGSLPSLTLPAAASINLSNNLFTGNWSDASATFCTGCSSLQDLSLSNNFLSGLFTPLSSWSNSLINLDLSYNLLDADMTTLLGIATLKTLNFNSNVLRTLNLAVGGGGSSAVSWLDVSNNPTMTQFTGTSGSLPLLSTFRMANDSYLGSIPTFLQTMTSLTEVDLSSNNFIGAIPSFLFTLPTLKDLDLSGNKLSGYLPSGTINAHLIKLDLSHNFLTGTLPSNFGRLTNLQFFKISYNSGLFGGLPDGFGVNWNNLTVCEVESGGNNFCFNSSYSYNVPLVCYDMISIPQCTSPTTTTTKGVLITTTRASSSILSSTTTSLATSTTSVVTSTTSVVTSTSLPKSSTLSSTFTSTSTTSSSTSISTIISTTFSLSISTSLPKSLTSTSTTSSILSSTSTTSSIFSSTSTRSVSSSSSIVTYTSTTASSTSSIVTYTSTTRSSTPFPALASTSTLISSGTRTSTSRPSSTSILTSILTSTLTSTLTITTGASIATNLYLQASPTNGIPPASSPATLSGLSLYITIVITVLVVISVILILIVFFHQKKKEQPFQKSAQGLVDGKYISRNLHDIADMSTMGLTQTIGVMMPMGSQMELNPPPLPPNYYGWSTAITPLKVYNDPPPPFESIDSEEF